MRAEDGARVDVDEPTARRAAAFWARMFASRRIENFVGDSGDVAKNVANESATRDEIFEFRDVDFFKKHKRFRST